MEREMIANFAEAMEQMEAENDALAAENASLKALVAEMAKGLEDTLEIAARNEMGDYATRALALIARAKETQ
jgi:cell division protein FtsB